MREARHHAIEQKIQHAEENMKRMAREVGKRSLQSSEANEKAQLLADIIEILGGVELQASKLPPAQLLSALLKLFHLLPPTLSSARRTVLIHRVIPAFVAVRKDWNPLHSPNSP